MLELGGSLPDYTAIKPTSKPNMNGNSVPPATDDTTMKSLLVELTHLFQQAIDAAYPDVDGPGAIVVRGKKNVIYQCNSAMPIAAALKKAGKPANPKEVADTILKAVPPNNMIKDVELTGPGFICITAINPEYIAERVRSLIVNGVKISKADAKSRVVVDYSSPNIAKEMHVGHLRSTIIGDAIANMLEFLGYDVVRLNHVGDWGTQFGMLLTHLVEKFPDYLNKPPPIADLQEFYKESKKRFDEDAEFKARAYQAVVKLQAKQPDMYKAWQLICDISRQEFAEVYARLNITPGLIERGESFYQDMMQEVVADLEKKGLLTEDEGRRIMWPSKNSVGIPLTVVKSDGGFTYDTSDMACIKHRIEVERADRVIYVTDSGQGPHFQLITACAQDAGYWDPSKVRVDHVGFGVVLGEDRKKFKTRSGESVRLRDLIDEGMERALAKLKEKERDKVLTPEELAAAQEAVAIGCIKYADLSHDRNNEYEFSFDRMLDDRGNTAVYLLYALTRIRSIARNAEVTKSPAERAQELTTMTIEHERELKLASFILKFPEILLQVADDLYPHSLCAYLYDLSVIFSEFYDKCYCIEKVTENGETKTRINHSRILLCDATALIMEKGLTLLGIKTLSRM